MQIKSKEISALIKEQIKGYEHKLETDDVGTVVTIGDGIALVYGLDKAMLGELLVFPNDVYGMIMNLEEEHVGCVLLGDDTKISEGDLVKRTHSVVEVPVGDLLLGRVVNALGQPIDGLGEIKSDKTRPIEKIAPSVITRESVKTPLQTGIKAIDAMIPIGRGQRELIIGDRQTGKTAIAIDAIINQKNQNIYCIYVAIGQKNSSVAQIVSKLKQHQALSYTVIVSATASELAPLQYIAPYAGMSMAEEWLDQGKDVLIVFDDLSKHAVSYRTLSLLLKRPPGREAYPGDVFYLHSRLLERACKLAPEFGGGSITALPIIETQAGDISAYIPTNVISITDGQIFLMSDLFNIGQRPAIDSGFSVSRVGSEAQNKAMKKVAKSLKIELANFNELQSFSQFGSDLDIETKKVLAHGMVLLELLKQDQYDTYSVTRQIIEIYAVKEKFLDDVELKKVRPLLSSLYNSIVSQHRAIVDELDAKKDISDNLDKKLRKVCNDFFEINK